MPSPLPVTHIFAFRAPVVNGSEIVVPVSALGADGRRVEAGIKADRSVWRKFAHELLGATVDQPARKSAKPVPMIEAAAAGRPLFKTGGRL